MDLNISETAKKHLGMADDSKNSPEEEIGSRNRINSIFQTIESSYEDTDDSKTLKSDSTTKDVIQDNVNLSQLMPDKQSKSPIRNIQNIGVNPVTTTDPFLLQV